MFSSKSFIVSSLTLSSLIHFEFIFVYGVRECSNFTLLHVVVQFSQHHLLKKLSSPLYTLASFAVDEFDNISSGLFLDSLFCSMDLCVCFCVSTILFCFVCFGVF